MAKLVVRLKKKAHAGGRRTKGRNLAIGKARFSIPAGKVRIVRVKLTQRGRAMLRRAGPRALKVYLVGRHVKRRAIVLKPAANRRPGTSATA